VLLWNRTACHWRRSYSATRLDSISITDAASVVLMSRRFTVRTVLVFVVEVRSANGGHFRRGGSRQCERWSCARAGGPCSCHGGLFFRDGMRSCGIVMGHIAGSVWWWPALRYFCCSL